MEIENKPAKKEKIIAKELIKVVLLPLIIIILNFILIFLNSYTKFPWIDIPMHFIGGATISLSFYLLLKVAINKKLIIKMHPGIVFLFGVSFVALAAICWEFMEYFISITTIYSPQKGISDTIADLFFGLLGSTVGLLYHQLLAYASA